MKPDKIGAKVGETPHGKKRISLEKCPMQVGSYARAKGGYS